MKKSSLTVRFNVIFLLVFLVFACTACGEEDALVMAFADENEVLPNQGETTGEAHILDIGNESAANETLTAIATEEHFFVDVCGAVRNPGVYELPPDSRIFEAVAMAGGFTEEACRDYLNQAQKIEDGMQIRIPTQEEVSSLNLGGEVSKEGGFTGQDDGRININTASKEQLCSLPGIGEAKAESIISYREQNNGFSAMEEIMNVEGIKDGLYAKIKDKIKI